MKKTVSQDVSIRTPGASFWRRTLLVMLLLIVGFFAVSSRLAVIQLAEGEMWQRRASEQQLSDSVISPQRGLILDANGTVLAQSVEAATVVMLPKNIRDEELRVLIADELSALLGVNRDRLYRQTGKTYSKYEIVCSKLDEARCSVFIEWVQKNNLISVFRILQDYRREYPLGSVLSCVIGFTGTDNTGLEGLEARYDSELAGQAGSVALTLNGWGDELPNELRYETTINAQQGNSLVLSVDVNIQRCAEKYLEIAVKETGATNRGCIIVMEVDTGAVLAMATKGDYDLNQPRVLQDPDTAAAIAMLAEDEQSTALLNALQKQWKNKAISEFYEPGSVFKMFTASMGLQEGLVNENTPFYCRGFYTMPGVQPMKCHVYPRSHGSQTFAEAISHSCNPAFMTLGGMVGGKTFSQYFQAFGFTATTGIDMLGEGRVTPSLYHAADTITALDVATSSIGQTFKVTPIQMITAACAVANGGRLMRPYIVSEILSADGTVINTTEPTVRSQVISEETSARICAMLEGVVDGGGAANAYVAGYRVGGKTGTSVKTDTAVQTSGRKNVVASFMGIAPANDPKIAILVMLDEPQTAIRYGGTLAAPVARKVLTEVLPYMGLEPHYSEKELKDLHRTVPNVTGKDLSVAQNALRAAELKARIVGEGSTVCRQVPAVGESIPTGGTVVLYTDEIAQEHTASVPEFRSMTLSEANMAAAEAGLNLMLSGLTDADGEAFIVAQSLAPGEQVSVGTVITLTIEYRDKIA